MNTATPVIIASVMHNQPKTELITFIFLLYSKHFAENINNIYHSHNQITLKFPQQFFQNLFHVFSKKINLAVPSKQ